MDAAAAVHPTDQTLRSHGLGKLDDALSRSVSKHLESCSACRRRVAETSSDSFLDQLGDARARPNSPALVVSADTGPSMLDAGSRSEAPPSAETLPPGLADHPDYEVIRELGQGGMGTVYLALNRLMGRHEVLKVVSSHLVKRRRALERFSSEIRNAARLHHTNIVTAYSAMRLGESVIFAMEYVEGLDLAKLVKATGPLPVANACNYAHQAALGLAHAHELGVVHRDIKPRNLMLARQGSRAVIKVLDFGLAKVKSEGAVDGGLTHEGQILGTPDYIAPEQIGDARRADIRGDIYSLGCTVYHLLTGGPPFKSTGLYEILEAHHSRDATPLNLARPEVPVELAALVAKMMAKEPERRFQSPKEVAQAMKPFFKPSGAVSGGFKPELSFPGRDDPVSEAGAKVSVAIPLSATHQPDRLPASKQAAKLAGAESVWEGLIDLGEPEPLTDSSRIVVDTTRRTPWAPWPITVAISVVGAAALWEAVLHITPKTDRRGSMVQGPENKGPQVTTNRSPAVDSKAETSHPARSNSTSRTKVHEDVSHGSPVVRPKDDASRSVTADSIPRSKMPEDKSDHAAASLKNADNRQEPLPQTVVEKARPATPAPSVRRVTVDSPDERLQKFGLRRAGRFYVLSQESDVVPTFNKARSRVDEYKASMLKKAAIEMANLQMRQLERDNNARDLQIDLLNRQLGTRPGRANSQENAQFEDIRIQRDELARQRSDAAFLWNELRSQLPSPSASHELDVAIEHGRAFCRRALEELGEMIKSADAKLAELKKNDQVRNALADAEDRKLGHTPEYQNSVKQVMQWEAFVKSPAATMQSPAGPVAKKTKSAMKKY